MDITVLVYVCINIYIYIEKQRDKSLLFQCLNFLDRFRAALTLVFKSLRAKHGTSLIIIILLLIYCGPITLF